mgnify:FL=1
MRCLAGSSLERKEKLCHPISCLSYDPELSDPADHCHDSQKYDGSGHPSFDGSTYFGPLVEEYVAENGVFSSSDSNYYKRRARVV